MNTRLPAPSPAIACLAIGIFFVSGCETSAPSAGAKPNLGPPMQDARMEAITQQMEMEYNAAKNSRPTYQHLAEKKKREAEAAAQRKKAEQEAAEKPKP